LSIFRFGTWEGCHGEKRGFELELVKVVMEKREGLIGKEFGEISLTTNLTYVLGLVQGVYPLTIYE
jgi:hypothetical protein